MKRIRTNRDFYYRPGCVPQDNPVLILDELVIWSRKNAAPLIQIVFYKNRNGLMDFFKKLFRLSNVKDHLKVREVVLERYGFDLGPSPEGPVFAMDDSLTMGVDVYVAVPVLLATGKIKEAEVKRSADDQLSLSRKIRNLVCSDPEVLYMLACARAIDIKTDE